MFPEMECVYIYIYIYVCVYIYIYMSVCVYANRPSPETHCVSTFVDGIKLITSRCQWVHNTKHYGYLSIFTYKPLITQLLFRFVR